MDVLTGRDSLNIMPPDFGPREPVYPALNSFCRVTASGRTGNVYPAFASQLVINSDGTPSLRDREPVFVFEPNGITLTQGYYDCRLVGSYMGLPLYATNCCPTSGGSSASAVPFQINTLTLPPGTHNVMYDIPILIQGGYPPIGLSIIDGVLPMGIDTQDDPPLLIGIPVSAGTYNFTLQAEDVFGDTADQPYTLVIT